MIRILLLNQLIAIVIMLTVATNNSSMAVPGRLLDYDYEGDNETVGQLLLRIIDDVKEDLEDDLKDEREDRILRESELTRDLEAERRERTELEASVNHLSSALSKSFSVAFHAVLATEPTIRKGDKVKFNIVKLNTGNGYDSSTGVFTVPSDGAGLYYFYVHVLVDAGEFVFFHLKRNDEALCTMKGDNSGNGEDNDTGTCAATVMLNEGDRVFVARGLATDNTPLWNDSSRLISGFTGFLMKPTD